jgi:gluconokinase
MARAVIMGVAGSGKSSVGVALAERIGAVYVDGDDLHSSASVAKMSAGQPLTDEDRAPWLVRVGETLGAASGPILIGCSALKRRYRDAIRAHAGGPVSFVHLSGSREVIASRMSSREGHFMPVSLIESQFAALEPLGPDEAGFAIDIDQPLPTLVEQAARILGGEPGWEETSL